MRILYFLSENLNKTGGGIVHFMSVAQSLRKLGHDVTIIAPQYNKTIRRFKEFRTIFLPVPGRNMFSYFWFQLLAGFLFPLIVLIHRPDALLIRGGTGIEFLIILVARLFGVRVALEVNGVPWEELESRGFPRLLRRAIHLLAIMQTRAANAIISVTPAIGERFANEAGVPLDRVFPIQNGADPEMFSHLDKDKIRNELNIAKDTFVVGFVGKFCTWHGIEEIVLSAAHLPPNVRKNVRYLLVGNGEAWETARQIVRDNALQDTILMPGMVPYSQVADYMGAFDVALATNSHPVIAKYGFSSLKFWEYLAAGIPVIARDDCNMTPLMEKYHMGLIVREITPKEIATVIMESWSRREELREIGRRNRQLVYDKFSWDHVARRIANVLAQRDLEENV